MNKQKKKVIISSVVLAVVTGVGTYNNWDVSGILTALKTWGVL